MINVLLMFGLTGLGRYRRRGWRRTFCVSVCVFAVHAFLVMKYNGLDPLELPLHWGFASVLGGLMVVLCWYMKHRQDQGK